MEMIPRFLAAVPSAWVTIRILFSLFLVLIASSAMFWALVRRWTSQREWVALGDWARETGFRFRRDPITPPEPLSTLRDRNPIVRVCMSNGKITIAQLEMDSPISPIAANAATVVPLTPPANFPRRALWNLLIRQIESTWKPTGLRPATAKTSLLDLFSLSSFPLMGPQERFVLFGADSAAARALSASPARALLPPDVGLLLHDLFLILDFSGRPFDSIEFSRMVILADQVAGRLPIILGNTELAST